MSMIEKLKKLFTKPSQAIADQLLFKGCKSGNVNLVKKALSSGADVNATRYVGEYSGGIGGRNNPSWQGTIEVTPLIYAATHAFGKADEQPYKDIIRLLAEKGVNTERVITGKEKYWEDDDFEICGFAPDSVKDEQYSLESVLKYHSKRKCDSARYSSPYEYCSISDSMTSYVAGLFDITYDGKLPSKLENKEAFLNASSAVNRKEREGAVAQALSTGRKPLSIDEVIHIRNAEEKQRLEANKLRMKIRKQQSR